MTAMLDNPKLMARLKLSIGTGTRGDRPMTPAEVALAIRNVSDETGDSIDKVARRLQVHPDTCRMFLSILDLPKDWRGMWHFGRADSSGRLPFSIAGKLGSRFKNSRLTKDDLDLLKGAALDPARPARRDDITNILSYHLKNPEKTLGQCIRDIMKMTPQKISSHVIITDIDPDMLAAITPEGGDPRDAAIGILAGHFPEGAIRDLRVKDGMHLQILLSEDGYDEFYALARRANQPAKNLINHLCALGVRER